MARLTPDRPRLEKPAQCAHCGTYGALGRCESCGAPNAPAASERPMRQRPLGTVVH